MSGPSTKIHLQDDYFRSTSNLVKLFYAKNLCFTRNGRSKRRNGETPVRNEKMIVYGPGSFLNDGLVVSSFSSFAVETEEPSYLDDGSRDGDPGMTKKPSA